MTQDPPIDEAFAIPKSVQLMWGLDQPGSRGPRKGLTLDQVLDAAIEVADAEGLAALSMSRLARQLGFTTMSVYRYVDSKDTLIQVLSDRVIGRPPVFEAGLPWRKALEEWAFAEFAAIFRHPWWLEIPLATPPAGPNNMAWLEAGLQALSPTALPEPLKFQLVANVSLYVIGRARVMREMMNSLPEEDGSYPAMLGRILDPEKFPALTRALSSQMFETEEVNWEEADFRFGLDRLLDGFERFVEGFE
ncbi:TetR/AcrR family transcriptional regulator [Antrihabitans sp. YC2-6]|uniref:TetR/AcrR family transcriptional regulator n=1 Tax=Antrihabitans sp. YC2-6 TaxID=2799498 RepID=UPI001F37792B|nr:TetR/AcrR family transcriptional regulator [Antrihabitans sp. YC2-6]